MACSVGDILQEECHLKTYAGYSEIIEDIPNTDKLILSIRIGTALKNIVTVCTHHSLKYGKYFASSFSVSKCCDPFHIHKKAKKSNLTLITLEHYNLNNTLIPGKSFCFSCIKKLRQPSNSDYDSNMSTDPDYVPESSKKLIAEQLNQSLIFTGFSAIKVAHLSTD
ncbi:ARL14 effector protein-like [Hydra vulgaris]|uniref:ARL14 effector protein-like n=1 Tax=Hydra vulgaris TaxID=6087 RepID=UPI001F5F24EB|nr:ARL14 effector protein-like [Hydra vulgaris]XP_047135264.1 ARL14 effector protein-like [Hydra vulgaris]